MSGILSRLGEMLKFSGSEISRVQKGVAALEASITYLSEAEQQKLVRELILEGAPIVPGAELVGAMVGREVEAKLMALPRTIEALKSILAVIDAQLIKDPKKTVLREIREQINNAPINEALPLIKKALMRMG